MLPPTNSQVDLLPEIKEVPRCGAAEGQGALAEPRHEGLRAAVDSYLASGWGGAGRGGDERERYYQR